MLFFLFTEISVTMMLFFSVYSPEN